MYVTDSRGSVYAVDAADGHLLWTYDVTNLIGGGAREGYVFRNRGVCYADGVVYTAAGSFLFALDAKTGKPIQGFGKDGQASVILDVLKTRYPDVKTAISLGYWFTTAPQVHNGVLYIGSTRSESHIPGGHVLAVDAKTGKVLWHFNTVPQDEKDQGWEIAGPTWVGGERNGGGIWETPSIDPELGHGVRGGGQSIRRQHEENRASTSSPIRSSRSTLSTGKLKWHYQQTHHDVWDYDSGGPPILFDMQVRGQRVRALAEASKNGYLYILNRETGQPVHPIKEMPVPTETARPDEHPWPTQPIPYKANGQPMSPVCPVFPWTSRRRRSRRESRCRISRRRARTRSARLEPAAARTTVRFPTARGPGCSMSRPSTARRIQDVRRKATSRPSIRRPESWSWQRTFEGRAGRIRRHGRRRGVRGDRQQRRRVLLCL